MYKKIGLFIGLISGCYAGESMNITSIESFWIWIALLYWGVLEF